MTNERRTRVCKTLAERFKAPAALKRRLWDGAGNMGEADV